jgi:hypothetical protein
VAQNEFIDGSAEGGKKFAFLHIQCSPQRFGAESDFRLITDTQRNRQVSQAIGLVQWDNIRVLTKAPGENAGPRSLGSHDENRFSWYSFHCTLTQMFIG